MLLHEQVGDQLRGGEDTGGGPQIGARDAEGRALLRVAGFARDRRDRDLGRMGEDGLELLRLGRDDAQRTRGVLGHEVGHGGGLQDAALADDDQVVGGEGHLAHQMRAQQYGAALRGIVAAQVAHPFDAFGIQTVDRLVEDQVVRVAQQGGCDGQALAHAQGERASLTGFDGGDAGQVHDLVHTALRDAVGEGDAQQVGVGATALVHGFGVQHRPDGPQRGAMLGERPAIDEGATGVRGDQAERGTHGGGLAGAIRPEKTGDFAVLGGEADVVQHRFGTEPFGEPLNLDHASEPTPPAVCRPQVGGTGAI